MCFTNGTVTFGRLGRATLPGDAREGKVDFGWESLGVSELDVAEEILDADEFAGEV